MTASFMEIVTTILFLQDAGVVDQMPAEVNCLARNIYYEARGEPVKGQFAVAHVTLNRVEDERWPDSICEVVMEPSQFSWTLGHGPVRDPVAFENAITVALIAMSGVSEDPTDGATFFHRVDISPRWSHAKQTTAVIGDHEFLR